MLLTADPFSKHMEAVARRLWGEPNALLSSESELRFGAHGSRSVDLTKGAFYDHEAEEGGGVLGLVERETRLKGHDAIAWLKDELDIRIEERQRKERRIVATYDYADEEGETLFQVVRFEPKDFRQRQPDARAEGGWSWSVRGVRQVPYRLPEIIEAIAADKTIFVVEGEKDADRLWADGVPATCNAGGAGKWTVAHAAHLRGADVLILPDNDKAGVDHRDAVAASLKGIARSVRWLALPDVPAKGDVADWLGAGHTVTELLDLVEARSVGWAPAPPASRFGAIRWADIDHVPERLDWLVDDLCFVGDSILIYGDSKAAKTFAALDMSLSIARGVPFLGKPTRKGAVIYQAGEGGKGLLKRMKAYRKHHEAWDDLPFVLLPERVDLFASDGDTEALIQEILAWRAVLTEPLQLVVIDTLSKASPGANENASEDMSRLLASGQRIQETAGCAVAFVHHRNAAGEKPRGHTSLFANADSALEVIRDEVTNIRTLRAVKVKDGEDGEVIPFQLQSVELGAYESGKPITSCVVVPAEAGNPQTGDRPGKNLSTPQRLFLSALEAAIGLHGGILPSTVNGAPDAYARGVDWKLFMQVYRQVANPDKGDEALRKEIERAGDYLMTRGLIGRDKPFIWLSDAGRRYVRMSGMSEGRR